MYSQNLPTPQRGNWLQRAALLGLLAAGLWLLNGCSGGTASPGAAATGEALITLTDAEGDFATYTVDVVSITLEKADGSLVETLPNSTRLDFTQYVDMVELITAAQIPNGRYVGGSITLDYTNADIQVDVNGMAIPAQVVDPSGTPLAVYSLDVQLENDRPLVVRPGLPALLNIDFDLAASHEVDTSTPVPTVTAEPFLVAGIEPVDEKQLRVRGPLVETNVGESYYRVRLRPWYRRDGDFGRARVNINDDTEFEINGESYTGSDGLTALEALGPGTPTVATGTLIPAVHEYTADRVLAGDSVPGHGFDAVRGNITARSGNVLIVRGATVIRRAGSVVFNDDVTVTVGNDTLVRKPGSPGVNQGIGALSVGQRVLILGTITSNPATPGLDMDATQGRALMRYTHLTGTANSVLPGQLDMTVLGIDHRRVQLFDFTGTGMSPDMDADPNDYEVDTGTLNLGFVVPQTPLRVIGFVHPFGEAPPDFEGRTVVDVAIARANLGVGWGNEGTTAPFIQMDPAGLVIDLDNPNLGERHHIRIGDVIVDLTQLPASPVIIGNSAGGRRFAIMQGHRVQIFRDFDRFVETLTGLLDGSTVMRSLYAQGAYDTASNTVHARTISVHLLPALLQ